MFATKLQVITPVSGDSAKYFCKIYDLLVLAYVADEKNVRKIYPLEHAIHPPKANHILWYVILINLLLTKQKFLEIYKLIIFCP